MLAFFLLIATVAGASSPPDPTFKIARPTIIAFFSPDGSTSEDPDTIAALDDFHFYATQARKQLEEAGVDFKEIYAASFRVRGKTWTTFRPTKIKVGYYFIAPNKKPRIEYGVMTDSELLQIAREYFDSK